MKGGFVAFLDVLGFSDLVREDHDGSAIQRYLACLRSIAPLPTQYVVFSDSIILTLQGDGSLSDLRTMCAAASRLMHSLLIDDIPVRGAISFGRFDRQEITSGSVFVAGSAIIDAYKYEQLQNWVGVMLSPTARKRFPELEQECMRADALASAREYRSAMAEHDALATYLQPYRIPFKPDDADPRPMHDGFAIVPTTGSPNPSELSWAVSAAHQRLDWLAKIAPSPAEQRKYEHSLNFVGQQARFWELFANALDAPTGPIEPDHI